jgi:hypothetical protein
LSSRPNEAKITKGKLLTIMRKSLYGPPRAWFFRRYAKEQLFKWFLASRGLPVGEEKTHRSEIRGIFSKY